MSCPRSSSILLRASALLRCVIHCLWCWYIMYLPGLWNFWFYSFFATPTDLCFSRFPPFPVLCFTAFPCFWHFSSTFLHSAALTTTFLHLLALWPTFPTPPTTFPCPPLVVVPHSLVFQLHTLIPGPILVYSPCVYTLHLRQVSPKRNWVAFPLHVPISKSSVQLSHIPDTAAHVHGFWNSNLVCIQVGQPPVGSYTPCDRVCNSFRLCLPEGSE